MLGWKIFSHAVRMLMRNMTAALRLSVGPILLVLAIVAVSIFMFSLGGRGDPIEAGQSAQLGMELGAILGGLTFLLAFFVAMIAAFLWVAVGWHRFILLQEVPTGLFPTLHGGAMASYFIRGIVISVATLIVLVVLALIGGALLIPFTTPGQSWEHPVLGMAYRVALSIAPTIVGYRLGVMLPAAAIGAPMGVRAAWTATRGANGAIIVLAVLSVVAGGLLQLLAMGVMGLSPILGGLLVIFVQWITVLVGLSILTTLYGHMVEHLDLT